MKTLITRAGPGTKVVVLGNISQIDTPYLTEGSSGLTYVVDRFKGWSHSGHVTLQRGERSRLADHAAEVLAAAALGPFHFMLAASATAFAVLKIAGATYLVYVGISLILSSRSPAKAASAVVPAPATVRAVFVQGFFTNVLNPKVALFFLAFLPQFIDPDAPNKPLAFIFLGAVFNFNGTLWNLFVAWFAARVSAGIDRSRLAVWFNRCIGSFFVYLGVRLAFAKPG